MERGAPTRSPRTHSRPEWGRGPSCACGRGGRPRASTWARLEPQPHRHLAGLREKGSQHRIHLANPGKRPQQSPNAPLRQALQRAALSISCQMEIHPSTGIPRDVKPGKPSGPPNPNPGPQGAPCAPRDQPPSPGHERSTKPLPSWLWTCNPFSGELGVPPGVTATACRGDPRAPGAGSRVTTEVRQEQQLVTHRGRSKPVIFPSTAKHPVAPRNTSP